MNAFYDQPKFLLWTEATLLLVIGFYPAIVIIELSFQQSVFGLLFLLYLPIGQFSTAPFFRLTGIYKYYSPMLIGYMANDIQIDLHSGGSFDYLFVMRKFKAGVELRNNLLRHHLQGLLHLIGQIENGHVPSTVNIVGTSYFFNSRTLNRLGFEVKTPSLFYRLNLFVNFIDLIWMYSVSQGRVSIPKIWNAKKASITGSKLVESKASIEEMYGKLTARITNII